MNHIRNAITALKDRNKRRLVVLLALFIALLGSAICVVLVLVGGANEMSLLERYLEAVPSILSDRGQQVADDFASYMQDYTVRGDFALMLYEQEDGERDERLASIKDAVSAQDMFIVDADGQVLASTASEGQIPRCLTNEHLKQLVSDTDQRVFDPNTNSDWYKQDYEEYQKEKEKKQEDAAQDEEQQNADDAGSDADAGDEGDDDSSYLPDMPVLYHAPLDDGSFLVVAMDFSPLGSVLKESGTWSVVLPRVLSGLDGYAFVKGPNNEYYGYPTDTLSDEDSDRLLADCEEAFKQSESFINSISSGGVTIAYGAVRILGQVYLAEVLPLHDYLPEYNETIMIAVPTKDFMTSAYLTSGALVVFIACSMILFVVYALLCARVKPIAPDEPKERRRVLRRRTWPGLIAIFVTSACFICLLIALEGTASGANVTKAQRTTILSEWTYSDAQFKKRSDAYRERYRTRAVAIAQLMSENEEYKSRESLQRLCKAAQVEYLMLFDKDGHEVCASNSYTGFTVSNKEDDPTHAYEAVLKGYPLVETPTTKSDITNSSGHTVAALITDDEGLADGFLVVGVNDDDFVKKEKQVGLEGTVNSYRAQNDQQAMLVDNETGLITAHTTKSLINDPARAHLPEEVLGRDFEGYSWYDGKYSYVSGGNERDGKSDLLVVSFNRMGVLSIASAILLILVTCIIIGLFFYPAATSLCAKIVVGEGKVTLPRRRKRSPMTVFLDGYVVYFTALAVLALVESALNRWPGFSYVIGGQWTYGINLFSIWAILLVSSGSMCVVVLLHAVVARIEDRVRSAQARTIVRLMDSLITYAAVIALGFGVLTMLGVDTTTVLASAGIASIAFGMGSKDLVADILAGVFIIFEGSIHVGDYVSIGGWKGRVTDMGIRTTEITDESNDVKILTNSRISEVINMSRVKTACTEDLTLPRTVDIEKLPSLVNKYIEAVVQIVPELDDNLRLIEVTQITEKTYTVRLAFEANEADRESLTFRLRNALQLLSEDEDFPQPHD